MKRITGLDTIRGACMWIMIYGHMIDWWLRPEDDWLRQWLFAFLESIGATGFLFISGVSAALAFRSNRMKLQNLNLYNPSMVRNVYFIRAFLILLIGVLYNFFVAVLWSGNIANLWSWLVLQTIGFSLILSWPFLGVSRTFRIIFGILIMLLNQFFLTLLWPYEDQANLFGFTFYLLFNPLSQYPILAYFSIFLIGTALGDKIFEINIEKNRQERKLLFKNKLIIPMFLIGCLLLIYGIAHLFPEFFRFNTIQAFAYSLGIILIVLSLFITKQTFQLFKTKKSYRYLFFYSYYSFTIYLGHNILFFLFPERLNFITIWIAVIIGNFIFGYLFRTMYIKLGAKASLKTGISVASFAIVKKFGKLDEKLKV
ncbi:MAG: heparan-alpha-glucosaminide N-acetyltransferase domain-containing protein [Promethearchaeota archaeon]